MKKGFTLYEMVVVLLIIGLLATILSVSQSLMQTAKDKTEVARFNAMREALAVYLFSNHNFWVGSTYITPQDLINSGLINKKDTISSFNVHGSNTKFEYHFVNFIVGSGGEFTGAAGVGSSLAVSNYQTTVYNASTSAVEHVRHNISPRFMCVVEKFLDNADDKIINFVQGDGRAYYASGYSLEDLDSKYSNIINKGPCYHTSSLTGQEWSYALSLFY